jgi:PPK2 family polyphosphate:nucleotide phosphotransferase
MKDERPLGGDLRRRLRVQPGSRVDLSAIDPRDTLGHREGDAELTLARGAERLADLQERLYAEAKHALLIVLQGMDTSGKDGTIKHVAGAFNPAGVQVIGFKVPTPEELAHDFLWREHRACPGKGSVAIFNRSHYESVLVERVHALVPAETWGGRFRQINEFERMLVETGTTVLKFCLHISKDKQRERLQERVDRPDKQWKFRPGDLDERKLWSDYRRAYEDALERTSTDLAPWYVIPADRKWFRNLAVAEIVADALDCLDLHYPKPDPPLEGTIVE